MKKFLWVLFLSLSMLLVGTTSTSECGLISFEIKLGGGLGLLFNGGGDLEKTRLGWQTDAADYAAGQPLYNSTSFNWKKLLMTPDFRGEFIVKIGNYFGLGLGAGYQWMKSEGTVEYARDQTNTYWWGTERFQSDDIYNHTYKISNIPIFMNFYGFLPLKGMSLYAYVGPSLNIASFSHDLTDAYFWNEDEYYPAFSQTWYDHYKDDYSVKEAANTTRIGFQGGLGLEILLSRNFALGIEVYGRYVNLANWTGTYDETGDWSEEWYYTPWGVFDTDGDHYTHHESGTLWGWTWHNTTYGHDYDYIEIMNSEPNWPGVLNVHPAEINFNAVGFLFNVIIHF